MGRAWVSPSGNLYASTLVTLREGDPQAATLALVAAVAAWHAAAIPAAMLKWPNDVMVGDGKLAGVLLERQGAAIVAGFGINVAHAPPTGRPTVCTAELGGATDADVVLARLTEAWTSGLADWRAAGVDRAIERWEALGPARGAPLAVAGAQSGRYAGLAGDGGLRLRLTSGAIRTIYSGEVEMVRDT